MKVCDVCKVEFEKGGGPGPKAEVLCPAHYFRFLRGSKSWRDPMLRQAKDAASERVRLMPSTKKRLEKFYAQALKTRPALPFYAFLDEVVDAGLATAGVTSIGRPR